MSSLTVIHAHSSTLAQAGLRSVLFKGGGLGKLDNVVSSGELITKIQEEQYDLVIIDYQENETFKYDEILANSSTQS